VPLGDFDEASKPSNGPKQLVGSQTEHKNENELESVAFLKHSFISYSQNSPNDSDIESSSLDVAETQDWTVPFQSISEWEPPMTFTLPPGLSSIRLLSNPRRIFDFKPQLVKVNMLVAVISVLATKTVKVRQTQRDMHIIEVVVGDESTAGFSVNFWVSPDREAEGFRKVLPAVRPRDVLLIRNVSLNTFRGKVNAQSVNPSTSRLQTTIEIIGRDGFVPGQAQGSLDSRSKLKRVTDWVLHFLGMDRKMKFDSNGAIELDDSLPPDSLPL